MWLTDTCICACVWWRENVRLCNSCLFHFGENGGNLYVQWNLIHFFISYCCSSSHNHLPLVRVTCNAALQTPFWIKPQHRFPTTGQKNKKTKTDCIGHIWRKSPKSTQSMLTYSKHRPSGFWHRVDFQKESLRFYRFWSLRKS